MIRIIQAQSIHVTQTQNLLNFIFITVPQETDKANIKEERENVIKKE